MSRDEKELRAALSGAAASGTSSGGKLLSPEEQDLLLRRRRFIQAGIGVSLVLTVGTFSALSVTGGLRPIARITPDREPPADGDELVAADQQGKVLTPEDIPLASGMVMAYPRDPTSQIIKSGTVDNLVLLARFAPASLTEATLAHAADGVVAYSAVCPHLGCTVSLWDADKGLFHCPCHHAKFDPRDDAHLVEGPSPRPLPALPLRAQDGMVVVAGGFLTPVGAL